MSRTISLDEIRAAAENDPRPLAERIAALQEVLAEMVARPIREARETLNVLLTQMLTAEAEARLTVDLLNEMKPAMRRGMEISSVRCAEGELLLRVYKLPDSSAPAQRWFCLLAVPTNRVLDADPYWMIAEDAVWRTRCRCHNARIDLTWHQVLGASPPPAGIYVHSAVVS